MCVCVCVCVCVHKISLIFDFDAVYRQRNKMYNFKSTEISLSRDSRLSKSAYSFVKSIMIIFLPING